VVRGRRGKLDGVAAGKLLRTRGYREKLQRVENGLIIDMDDTLNSNLILFTESRTEIFKVYGALTDRCPGSEELAVLLDDSTQRWIPIMGYTPQRWYHCANEVAETILGRTMTRAEAERVKQAADIALGVGELLPGVTDALEALRGSGIKAVLKTKGEQAKQQEKLDVHGLSEAFHGRVEIVSVKDAASFQAIAAKYSLQYPISIGDSEKSDVIPAQEAGFEAVLIDHGAGRWNWDPTQKAQSEFMRVGSFAEALIAIADRSAESHTERA
jgi:FMN phosphatase YigB (HAD superfamily)